MLLNSRPPGATQLPAQLRIAHQSLQRSRQSSGIAGRHQQTRFAVHDRFGNAGQPRGDHGPSGGHCLDDYGGENVAGALRIDHRGEREDIGSRDLFQDGSFRQRPQQLNPARKILFLDPRLQLASQRAVADDFTRKIETAPDECGTGVNKAIKTLERHQTPDTENAKRIFFLSS